MVNKPFILIPIILLLIALSGCIHILTTAERQACLSATHASTNSISECKTQNECYNKLTEKTTISKKLPINIYNNNVIYFNNVASATHNFNTSKNGLEKLNESCNVEDVEEIIDSANDFFLYLRNIFSFIDKSNQTSIILLKDYAIYLESQGINKIPEEDIFLDYVIINDNLNELKINSNNENYISNLLIKSKELNNIARDFGFKKDYISNVNYLDLTAYYLKLVDDPSGNIKIPTISPGINYMICELSNIEQLKNITKNLQRANSYNLYVTLDKSIGRINSLHSKFREINESININLNKIYTQIEDKETKIENNKTYISKSTQYKFKESYVKFRNQEIGFGDYLAQLKNIELEMEKNKITEEDKNIEIQIEQIKCEEIISNAKKINNNYINTLITRYEIADNYTDKKEYCEKINRETKIPSCKIDLANVLEEGDESINKLNLEFNENIPEMDCINTINNINQILENNDEIKLLKDIIKDNQNMIIEIKQRNEWTEYEDQYVVEEINELTKTLNAAPNYKLIINLNEKIDKQQINNKTLLNICTKIEEKYILKNHKIEFSKGEYYLVIYNLFSKSLNEIKLQIPEINCISKLDLYPGINYIKISYENKQIVNKNILKLGLEKTLFEIIIKNTVTGIYDQIFIGQHTTLISGAEIDANGYAWYFSEIENRVLFYQSILDSTSKNISIMNIGAENYKIITEINIRNKYDKEINGALELQETNANEICVIKEKNKIIPFKIINNYLVIQLKLAPEEETTYQIQILKDKNEIIQIAKEAQNNAQILMASRFKNISSVADQELGKYAIQEINENTTLEIFSDALLLNTKIIKLQIQEKECQNLEDEYFLIYTSILQNESINEDIKKEINKIDDEKYKDILTAVNKIKEIKTQIENNDKIIAKIRTETEYNKLKEIKDKIYRYNLEDSILVNEIENASFSNQPNIADKLENQVNIEIKEKAKKINELILAIDQTISSDIEKDIELGKMQFQDFDLQELYTQGYFPLISLPDIERLEKNYKFLNTVALSEEINAFKSNYIAKDYEPALNSISENTISRLENILLEKENVDKGILKLKEDAKNKLNQYIKENQNTKSIDIKNKINLAKEYYAQEKYLNTISLVSTKLKIEQKMQNKQIILILLVGLLFLVISNYLIIGKRKKNTEDINERKKHIIRHN